MEEKPSPGVFDLLTMGMASALMIGAGLGIGLAIDDWLHSSPIATLVGLAVGITAAIGEHDQADPQVPLTLRGDDGRAALMVDVFSHFSLPQMSTVARRTALAALCVGVVALAIGVVADYVLVGVGVCLGLAIALGNFRLISAGHRQGGVLGRREQAPPAGVQHAGPARGDQRHRPRDHVLRPPGSGFGTLVGLAVFQFALLGNVVVAMLRDPLMGDTTMGERPRRRRGRRMTRSASWPPTSTSATTSSASGSTSTPSGPRSSPASS